MTVLKPGSEPESVPRGGRRVPTVSPWKPANLVAFRRHPLRFLADSARIHGDIFRFYVLGLPMIIVNNPANIEHVLVHRSDNYDKRAFLFKITQPVLGNGLISNPGGEQYRRQRKLMQPFFQPKVVMRFAANMTDETKTRPSSSRGRPRPTASRSSMSPTMSARWRCGS